MKNRKITIAVVSTLALTFTTPSLAGTAVPAICDRVQCPPDPNCNTGGIMEANDDRGFGPWRDAWAAGDAWTDCQGGPPDHLTATIHIAPGVGEEVHSVGNNAGQRNFVKHVDSGHAEATANDRPRNCFDYHYRGTATFMVNNFPVSFDAGPTDNTICVNR